MQALDLAIVLAAMRLPEQAAAGWERHLDQTAMARPGVSVSAPHRDPMVIPVQGQ